MTAPAMPKSLRGREAMTQRERDALCMDIWTEVQAAHARWRETGDPADLAKAKALVDRHNRIFLGGEP